VENKFVSANADGKVMAISMDQESKIKEFQIEGKISNISCRDDGKLVVVGTNKGLIYLLSTKSLKLLSGTDYKYTN
jgi:tricorn protease-like protein